MIKAEADMAALVEQLLSVHQERRTRNQVRFLAKVRYLEEKSEGDTRPEL